MLYQLSYFRFFRFFRAIPSLDFVFSVSHYREVTPSLVARPPRTHSEINFKNLCCFPGDFCVRLRLNLWEKMDSNHRRYKPADLQSAPFGHSGILPFFRFFSAITSSDFISSLLTTIRLLRHSLFVFLVLPKNKFQKSFAVSGRFPFIGF